MIHVKAMAVGIVILGGFTVAIWLLANHPVVVFWLGCFGAAYCFGRCAIHLWKNR